MYSPVKLPCEEHNEVQWQERKLELRARQACYTWGRAHSGLPGAVRAHTAKELPVTEANFH